jgi:hypothetical protein
MTKIRDNHSMVAIDPTCRGLGFVFFERGELMDWGNRRFGHEEQSGLDILDRLLDGCAADLLVLEDPEAFGALRRSRVSTLLRSMARRARQRGTRVILVARAEVREAWCRGDVTTKQAAAVALGAKFPELGPLVPARRKLTQSEAVSTSIFDALTLLLHAFGYSPADDLAA